MEVRQKFILAIISIVTSYILSAQQKGEAPILFEAMFGDERYGIQSIVNRSFPRSEKLSFFSVTSIHNNYSYNVDKLDFVNTSQLAYNVHKGFGLTGGLNVNKVTGLSPTLGVRYVYASPKWAIVITPDYIFTGDRNVAIFSLFEFRPELTENLRLYSRIQGLYNHNLNLNDHQRSYLQLRLGIGFNEYNFGLATNLDYFGPDKNFTENYGVFIRADL